jgi:hypothetical protein
MTSSSPISLSSAPVLLACCAAACGNDDDPRVACEPAAIETIISRPDLSPFGLELVLSPGGARHIAYELDDDIFVIDDHGGWSEPTLVTADVEGLHGQPSMVEGEGMLHLVWRRKRSVEYVEPWELLYSTRAVGGGEWTEPVSLTRAFDSAESHHAYHPQLARAPDGELRVAYSSQFDSPDTIDDPPPPESRVIGVDGGAPTGRPVTVLPAFLSGGCMEPRAQFDGDGALHVVSSCSPYYSDPAEPRLYHAVRTAGTWHDPAALPDNEAGEKALAAGGPDGALHVAWAQMCPGYDPSDHSTDFLACLYHSVYREGAFSPPAKVYEAYSVGLFPLGLAVDQDGRVLIAFSPSFDPDPPGPVLHDVSLTQSTDGASFSEPCDLTRTADIDDEDAVVQFDAETGEAHVIVTSQTRGDDDDYRFDLVHARLP